MPNPEEVFFIVPCGILPKNNDTFVFGEDVEMKQVKSGSVPRRVSANALAAMLASDGWLPERGNARKGRRRSDQKTFKTSSLRARMTTDRETAEALPAGHPVSWNALWGADLVPVFPGLQPMGGRDVGMEIN
ncbi:transcriptional regulator [Gluconobacter kondonii]|uniref:transcriptional regulator n=1 Tax=Gluconobacter kondonii TaxID=941463 RepID=UPI002012D3F3|nr:transcriptional regulator [Gluconobacter kondonii]